MPGVRSAVQFPIPDPALTRGRVFSGGVAVIADTWYQAKTALDKMPIEWEIPPANAAFNSANMRESLLAALDRPGTVRADQGDVDAAFAARREDRRGDLLDAVPAARPHGAGQRHGARQRRPRRHLDRRSEPAGNALQRREDHRDSRDQRPPAPVPPGRRLRPQRQRAAGRARDHDRQRAPRHADPHAVDARGGLHRHDVSRHGRGASQGRPRCRRLADRARRAHGHAGRRLRSGGVVPRDLALPRAELSLLEPHDEVPRPGRHAPRRRPGRARVLSRELHGRARPRRRQGSVSLSPRAARAHQPALQARHDHGARHGRRDVGLGHAAPEGHGAGHRASRSAAPKATAWRRSAPWCTPSR